MYDLINMKNLVFIFIFIITLSVKRLCAGLQMRGRKASAKYQTANFRRRKRRGLFFL